MNNELFDYFMNELMTDAVKEFKSTEESGIMKQRLEQMDIECESMFTKNQHEFAEGCFGLIMEANGREEVYVYRKAFRDCVSILKALGVLA